MTEAPPHPRHPICEETAVKELKIKMQEAFLGEIQKLCECELTGYHGDYLVEKQYRLNFESFVGKSV